MFFFLTPIWRCCESLKAFFCGPTFVRQVIALSDTEAILRRTRVSSHLRTYVDASSAVGCVGRVCCWFCAIAA